jgi:hypothetical protein
MVALSVALPLTTVFVEDNCLLYFEIDMLEFYFIFISSSISQLIAKSVCLCLVAIARTVSWLLWTRWRILLDWSSETQHNNVLSDVWMWKKNYGDVDLKVLALIAGSTYRLPLTCSQNPSFLLQNVQRYTSRCYYRKRLWGKASEYL